MKSTCASYPDSYGLNGPDVPGTTTFRPWPLAAAWPRLDTKDSARTVVLEQHPQGAEHADERGPARPLVRGLAAQFGVRKVPAREVDAPEPAEVVEGAEEHISRLLARPFGVDLGRHDDEREQRKAPGEPPADGRNDHSPPEH